MRSNRIIVTGQKAMRLEIDLRFLFGCHLPTGFAFRILRKVGLEYVQRLAPPSASRPLESANELFFFVAALKIGNFALANFRRSRAI